MSSDANKISTEPKKKLNYNPLRPGYNPLRPQSQQNSRNTSSVTIGSELHKDASTNNIVPNATNTSNNNDPHKTIYISQSGKEKPSMNQEEVDKLNEDIDQLSKNINEHLQMSENKLSTNPHEKNEKSLNSLSVSQNQSRTNLLQPSRQSSQSRTNLLQPSRQSSQSQTNLLQPSQQESQSQTNLLQPSQQTSQSQTNLLQPTNQASQSPNSIQNQASSIEATQTNKPNNDTDFDKLDPDTEICVQPTNLNPDRSKPIYCEYCHEKIVGSILSSGKKFYHPKHFLCNGCNCPLNGKPFFEIEERALCVDCYNNQHGVKCAFCNEFITGQYITALDKNWHPDHLRCSECNEPINSIIEEKDGKAYCHKDYQKLFGICCNKCHEPILSGGYITALDKPWHVDCFVCNICNKPFTSTSFYEIDGFPYCSEHYEIASQCNFCKTKIVDNKRIKVGDYFYHSNHVFCTCCKKAISELITNDNGNYDGLFKITDNNIICKNCVASQVL